MAVKRKGSKTDAVPMRFFAKKTSEHPFPADDTLDFWQPVHKLFSGPECLADVPARVLSHTSDFLAYTPNPPFQFGHIDFEGGGRVLMEFADTDPKELRVGLPLRMVYRIKDFDRNRGFRRYFWKATPVRAAAENAAPERGVERN